MSPDDGPRRHEVTETKFHELRISVPPWLVGAKAFQLVEVVDIPLNVSFWYPIPVAAM